MKSGGENGRVRSGVGRVIDGLFENNQTAKGIVNGFQVQRQRAIGKNGIPSSPFSICAIWLSQLNLECDFKMWIFVFPHQFALEFLHSSFESTKFVLDGRPSCIPRTNGSNRIHVQSTSPFSLVTSHNLKRDFYEDFSFLLFFTNPIPLKFVM